MQDKKIEYKTWKEYPERDTEYVRYYPPTVGGLDPGQVWQKKKMGIYIQIPFCKSICKYCPFNKYPWQEEKVKRYLSALKKEIKIIAQKPQMQAAGITVLNFGGGTPTALDTGQLVDLLDYCRANFDILESAEISVEANPETVDESKLKALLDWGVNRISFGVQSFNDRFLEMIGRTHKAAQSIDAIKLARRLGLENIGIDLLYRIPGQTMDDWERELQQAIDLKIDHISIFSLLLNPGTRLFRERMDGKIPHQPEEDVEIAMYKHAIRRLSGEKYNHYIVYDFALPGKECEYHSLCWRLPQGEYPGLGAGANSYINGYLYTNINPLDQYIQTVESGQIPISFGRKLTKKDEISRALVLGTKFLSVGKQEFREQFGVEIEDVFGEIIPRLKEWGLVTDNRDSIDITPKGKIYMSNLNKAFYADEHKGKPQPIGVKLQKGDPTRVGRR